MMRLLRFAVCIPLCLAAQDAKEIVRKSLELNRRNIDRSRDYSYTERRQERSLDGSGKVRSKDVLTWEVTWEEGSPYRKLVSRNDQPLPPKEKDAEECKLRDSIGERRKETAEDRQRRIAAWRQSQEKRYKPAEEMLEGFDFRLAGEENLNGTEVFVIDATPRPGFAPKSRSLFYLPKIKARLWIDKREYQWIKVNAEAIDTISFGGFLLRVAKGAQLKAEQQHVDGELWVPKLVVVAGAGRIALFKQVRGDIQITYGEYRKSSGPGVSAELFSTAGGSSRSARN